MTEPVAILHLIWALPRRGAERVAADLARGLNGEAFRISVGCLTDTGALADELTAAGIDVFHLHKRPGFDLSVVERLVAAMQTRRIEIVHTHLFTANLWGRIAARKAGVRTVITHEHSTFTLARWWRRTLDHLLLGQTSRVITVSEDLRQRFIQAGYAADKLITIQNGVRLAESNTLDRTAARERFGLTKKHLAACIVGAIEPRKDHRTLLAAWGGFAAAQRKAGREAILLIAGDGPLRSTLENSTKGDRSIRWLGNIAGVNELLAAGDLYVSSSLTEGTSIALLEAMSAGIPIVTTAVGGNPEVLDAGAAGLLCAAGDELALAAAMGECVSSAAAAITTKEIRVKHARERVREHYDLAAMHTRVAELYRSCLREG